MKSPGRAARIASALLVNGSVAAGLGDGSARGLPRERGNIVHACAKRCA
ncbi:hypothetical protein PT2222_350077 [Paraburkholderia tropica]